MSVNIQSFQIGSLYRVSFYAPAILGAELRYAQVLGISAYTPRFAQQAASIHYSILPELPVGTPQSPSALKYVIFLLPDGTEKVVALEWISQDPVLESTQGLNISVADANPTDIAAIRGALAAIGLINVSFQ